MLSMWSRYSYETNENYTLSTEYPTVENSTCPDYEDYKTIFIHGTVGLAVVIIFIFSFLEKRINKWPDCCHARPGLVVPINLLDDYRNKWGYAFAFGAITNTIVIIFTNGSDVEFSGPLYQRVILSLLTALEMCVNLSPFFVCIATEHKIVGSLIGFFYAALWFGVLLYFTLACLNPVPDLMPYLGLVVQMPTLACLGALTAWYLVTLGMTLYKRHKRSSHYDVRSRRRLVVSKWHANYVKDLFKYETVSDDKEDATCKEKMMKFILRYVFAKRPNFEFSTRIFCTVFVVFMCTYQLGVTYFWFYDRILSWFNEEIYTFLDLINMPANNTFVNNAEVSLKMLSIGWQTTIAFTLLLFVIDITAIFFRYRKHMLKLYRGDKSFMPHNLNTDPAEVLRCCMLYSGYQVAYMIWGFFVLNFTTWIIVLLFCFVIILPAMNRNYTILQYIVEAILIPMLLNFIFRTIQKQMARHWFLQPKINPEDKTKPLSVDNRRFFHIINYFFFFANITTGLFSCLIRILKGLAFGLVFLGRIDRCVLMRGAEAGDKGYTSYLGMIRVEATHNHPIMRMFCQIILDATRDPDQEAASCIGDPEIGDIPEAIGLKQYSEDCPQVSCRSSVSRRVRRRWWLLFTLMKNPGLIVDRRFDLADEHQVAAREMGINVLLARKQKYDRLKKELDELEKVLRDGNQVAEDEVEGNRDTNVDDKPSTSNKKEICQHDKEDSQDVSDKNRTNVKKIKLGIEDHDQERCIKNTECHLNKTYGTVTDGEVIGDR